MGLENGEKSWKSSFWCMFGDGMEMGGGWLRMVRGVSGGSLVAPGIPERTPSPSFQIRPPAGVAQKKNGKKIMENKNFGICSRMVWRWLGTVSGEFGG